MTEFISRKYGNEGYEVIIKTDSHEHYKASEDFARRLIGHAKPVTDNNVGCKWIPVSERLPEKDLEDVLAFDGISGFFITFMKTTIHGKRYFVIGHDDVTHWMTLPEPPKEEADA